MNIVQLTETISYTEDGITIYIHLDYETGKVSLVDENRNDKKWLFSGRGVEYLGNWVKILTIMENAVMYADTRLKEQSDVRVEKLMDVKE